MDFEKKAKKKLFFFGRFATKTISVDLASR